MIGIKNFFVSQTGKDSGIVIIGTVLNVVAGGLFFILVPRFLGPDDYGLFSTILATGLAATAIANFGIDTGILRFAKKDPAKLNLILSMALKSYLVIGFVVALIGLLISQPLSQFLGHPEIAVLLKVAFIGNIFLLLTNLFVAGLQAKNQFAKASQLNIASNILRLFLLVIAAYFFTVNLFLITILFFLIPVISVAVGKILMPIKLESINKKELINFHKYNLWIGLSLIIASVPFDNYFILKLAGTAETGLYAAPFKILAICYQFGGNLTRVLAPRLTEVKNPQQLKDLIRLVIPLPLAFIIGLLILIPLANILITILFGQTYASAISIFRILTVGFIFFFAGIIPSAIILYHFGKSNVSFAITFLRYLVFVVLLALFVPGKGAAGAAIAFTSTEFFSFILMTAYTVLNYKNHDT